MILINAFKAEPEELRLQELTAAERVLRSGWFILGREVQQFEDAWAQYCGVRFCVGVGNGMEAIEIGLRAMRIGLCSRQYTGRCGVPSGFIAG